MNFKDRYQYNSKTDLLGKGGFARVFKAYYNLLKRMVALKIFSSEATEKYDLVAEISRVISLEHPNLCRYYDVAFVESVNGMGDEERIQIGVMEYLDGNDLKNYLRAHPQQQVKLLTDVLNGLSFLHKRGIIHRDLKPANILIKNTEDGPVAKITDFGISKDVDGSHTSSSLLMGTIEYMAPEQFNPAKYGIDGRIGTNLDLWSFGLMVYELVTSESLFGNRGGNSSAEQVMGNILNDELIEDKIAHLPEPYLSVVKCCLIKDAKKRVQSAEELTALLNGEPSPVLYQNFSETQVLNKPKTIASETQILHKQQATKQLSEPMDLPKKNNVKKSFIGATILLVILLGGFWAWKIYNGSNRNLIPVMDATTKKWGYKDSTTNELVIPYQYDWADKFSNSCARVNKNLLFGLIDKNNNPLTPVVYNCLDRSRDGIMFFREKKRDGYLDSTGKVVISHGGSCFSEGLAAVVDNTTNKFGFINRVGKMVIPFIYDFASEFQEGLSAAQKDGKCGYIDKNGKTVIPFIYDGAEKFSQGFACVYRKQESGLNRPFIIDNKGNPRFHELHIQSGFSSNLAPVITVDQKYGYVDIDGTVVIPCKYDGANGFNEGMAIVTSGNKKNYINPQGVEVISIGNKYEQLCNFSDGLASVLKNNKWGCIDKKGNLIIPFKFKEPLFFLDGMAIISLEGRSTLIDKTGKIVGYPYD